MWPHYFYVSSYLHKETSRLEQFYNYLFLNWFLVHILRCSGVPPGSAPRNHSWHTWGSIWMLRIKLCFVGCMENGLLLYCNSDHAITFKITSSSLKRLNPFMRCVICLFQRDKKVELIRENISILFVKYFSQAAYT